MMVEPPAAEPRGLTIVRVFHAPRRHVWAEWTTPASFADWYGGAEGEVPVETVTMDVRPGGAWRATMFAGPARRQIHWEGEYREVIEPTLLALTISDQPGEKENDLVTVLFTDLGDGRTEMLFRQRDHMSAEQYERAGQGWGGFFDRLADRLGALR